MNRQLIEDLARDLSRRRSLLLQDAAQSQDEMKAILGMRDRSAYPRFLSFTRSGGRKIIGGLINAGSFDDDVPQCYQKHVT